MYGLVPRFCSINTVMSRPPKYLLPFMCARFETGKWLAIQASYFSVSLELSVTISLGTNDWESHGNNECCLQFSSVAQSCLTLCDPMNHSMPGLPVHHQLPESTQTHVYCVGDAIQPSHPLSSPFSPLPSIFPSIRVFSNGSGLRIRWPKYWSFSFNIIPSNEHSGLISFRMDWLDLLAVQGTLKSLLQHHSSKASILRCSAFFIVQLSHPYIPTRKTIALNICWQSNVSAF